MKIRDFIHSKTVGDIGIELEVESTHEIPGMDRGDWVSKAEGSLRNFGIEFVSRVPFFYDENFSSKIFRLTDHINNKKYGVVQDCPRTSLHVHCSVLDDTPAEVWSKIITYWLVEDLLMKYCGEEQREGNLFCLRLKDAEGILEHCYRDLKDVRGYSVPFIQFGDNLRYGGQNLAAVNKFGSLEYRGMRGTTDPEVILTWSSNLYRMGNHAKALGFPSDVLDTYYRLGPKGFVNYLFTPGFVAELGKFKGWEDSCDETAGTLCALGYFHDWKAWNNKFQALPKKTKPMSVAEAFANAAPPQPLRRARRNDPVFIEE